MRVAVVRPRYKSHLVTPPLGMGYVSSYMKSKGYEVTFVDGLRDQLSNEKIADRCRDIDVVGISCLSDYAHETYALSRLLTSHGKTVVIGGPHPTALPRHTLQESEARYVVLGEGETAFHELIQHLEAGGDLYPDIPGVGHARSERFLKRPARRDLDELPFPDWDSMRPASYPKAPHGGLVRSFPIGVVVSTRGCPYACTFCSSPQFWDRQFNRRSPDNVVDEIEMLKTRYGVREIHFEDDNLTLNRRHIEDICHELIERRINLPWACPNGVRADRVDEPLLRLMKKAGCYSLAFGIESGSQEILDNVSKAGTLSDMATAVTTAAKLGIVTQGFFIFGLPGETAETVRQTIDFAKSLPLTKAQFLLFDVFPGCELWDELQGQFEVDFGRESYHEVTWCPPTIRAEDLEKAQGLAFREFFLQPRSLWYILRYARLSQFRYIYERIRDFGVFRLRNPFASLKTGKHVHQYDARFDPEHGRERERRKEMDVYRVTARTVPQQEWERYQLRTAGPAAVDCADAESATREGGREELLRRNRDCLI